MTTGRRLGTIRAFFDWLWQDHVASSPQFLRREFVPSLIVAYLVVVVLVAAFGVPDGVSGGVSGEASDTNRGALFYRSTRELPPNTRIRAPDVERPHTSLPGQFWRIPDFDRQMKDLYTTRTIPAHGEIDPAMLASRPELSSKETLLISLEKQSELQDILNAGSDIVVCDSSGACTSVHPVEAVLCTSGTSAKCYAAIDAACNAQDLAVLKHENLRVLSSRF
ncbi:hypothetical protein SBC1_61060 (plasmid) [Caballeronia sp. SBC1]|uniref:hypothetical protein n=1 Tax=unclassified Caballeronia TaxID=2646786 RepID=UPI0013E0F4B9|nr:MULTISPECIES: hypothetical protein [unclassified Caballeronia]QIE27994.1 hypothetical protein SBC2_60690 [Caballeronia sp. SBC2]QIN66060.1 hypothetical protein SBC1_61060 [Caballeronia sp. SBC1]